MRQTLLERTLGLQYVGAIMFAFGGLALLLAVIGVYGVMASMVTQPPLSLTIFIALSASVIPAGITGDCRYLASQAA
jgi:hypothetical protein